jgi:hypothetical protein
VNVLSRVPRPRARERASNILENVNASLSHEGDDACVDDGETWRMNLKRPFTGCSMNASTRRVLIAGGLLERKVPDKKKKRVEATNQSYNRCFDIKIEKIL